MDVNTVNLNGFASPDVEQQILYNATNLAQGQHDLQIVNAGNPDGTNGFLDIDFLIWETEVLNGTTTQLIDNTDPRFTYAPSPAAWGNLEDASTSFNASLTSTIGLAQARFDFVGEIVALFGTLGPSHGNYTCAIDDGVATMYSGTYPSIVTEQMLCFAGSLAPGNHSIIVGNVPTSSVTAALTVDYAQVWGVPVNETTPATTPSGPGPIAKPRSVRAHRFLALLADRTSAEQTISK